MVRVLPNSRAVNYKSKGLKFEFTIRALTVRCPIGQSILSHISILSSIPFTFSGTPYTHPIILTHILYLFFIFMFANISISKNKYKNTTYEMQILLSVFIFYFLYFVLANMENHRNSLLNIEFREKLRWGRELSERFEMK